MGASCYLPQINIKTTSRVVIFVWIVIASVVVQLSHGQVEMTTTISSTIINETSRAYKNNYQTITNNKINNNNGGRFSSLEKEVVERLIKEWAPVVWLAPEEKFMPLGVEEFLGNVHAVDKGNAETEVKGMPIGDNSKKAYLVTNAEIDELLENDGSFLHGKDPNQHHVPIYAVVRLCSNFMESPTTTTSTATPNTSSPSRTWVLWLENYFLFIVKPLLPPQKPIPQPQRRVPYIPVSINESGEASNTIRRSSRLFPGFSRNRRRRETSKFFEKRGTIQENAENSPISTTSQKPTTDNQPISTEKEVSEFIANLVDNVKFNGDSGMNNNINEDNIEPQKNKENIPAFHVTFWMFYPYSQGKTMCTVSLGVLGSIPFPAVYGYCLGNRKDIGSHVGDWEHMSLYFDGTNAHPKEMYVSAHDAGAYYTYNHLTGSFEFRKQETRKGILQRPNFPKTVTTFLNHPVLFAAKGSHGLWTAPGKHRFVKVARLYDVNGFGTPWHTWKAVDVSYENLRTARSFVPNWLNFKGKWGNPKSKCHPLRRIGLNFCEYSDGPTGIPLKEPHFQCDAPNVL
ncbi:uncharacterized protein LOC129944098 [Eupeodes corollae]|uniref:uncharacterized protein LOC129944098 n=1 Tax=Eupeodes corollae TaxID=290404 RepID=UPI002490562B|nr:uncharacterized protein LOC129944098 [Eupeodes corollae]